MRSELQFMLYNIYLPENSKERLGSPPYKASNTGRYIWEKPNCDMVGPQSILLLCGINADGDDI